MQKIRILLVDDQQLFLRSLAIVFRTATKDLDVVGTVTDGSEAVSFVDKHDVDIVLMDVYMPVMDGVEAAKIIHNRHPHVKIVMLTTYDDDECIHKAIEYGAVGYLLKDKDPLELILSIRAIYSGSFILSDTVASKLFRSHGGTGPTVDTSAYDLPDTLSHREKGILVLLIEGMSNTKIAESLLIAEQTVRNYVSGIYSKTVVHDRLELIRRFRDARWTPGRRAATEE